MNLSLHMNWHIMHECTWIQVWLKTFLYKFMWPGTLRFSKISWNMNKFSFSTFGRWFMMWHIKGKNYFKKTCIYNISKYVIFPANFDGHMCLRVWKCLFEMFSIMWDCNCSFTHLICFCSFKRKWRANPLCIKKIPVNCLTIEENLMKKIRSLRNYKKNSIEQKRWCTKFRRFYLFKTKEMNPEKVYL